MGDLEALPSEVAPPRRHVVLQRDFGLFLAGTTISIAGDLLQMMALTWWVFQKTGSGLYLGVLGFCIMVPRLLLGAAAGVLADRLDRRWLLFGAQVFGMVQALALYVLVARDLLDVPILIVLTLALGVADTLHRTTRVAIVPSLVAREDLQRGVALNELSMNLAQVIAPACGGVLIGLVGARGCLLINALSYVAILGALLAMRRQGTTPPARTRASFKTELADGVVFILRRVALWEPIALAFALAALALGYPRLLPMYASDLLAAGARGYGLLLAATGIGSICGSLLVAVRGAAFKKKGSLYPSLMLALTMLALFASSRRLYLSLAALAVVGASQVLFRTTVIALCHGATDESHRGRVLSILLLDFGLWSLGSVWLGWLADRWSPTSAMFVGVGSCALVALGVAYAGWSVRRRDAQRASVSDSTA